MQTCIYERVPCSIAVATRRSDAFNLIECVIAECYSYNMSPAADGRIYYVSSACNNFNSWAIMTLARPLRKRSSQRDNINRVLLALRLDGGSGSSPRSWNLITRTSKLTIFYTIIKFIACVQLHNIKIDISLRVSISSRREGVLYSSEPAIKPKGFQQAWSKYQFTIQRWIPSLSLWLAPQARA